MIHQSPELMSEDDAWAETDRQRLDLADLLEGLSVQQWSLPSLCAGWRIRDVAAHLALAHTGPQRAAIDLVRAGGRFQTMIYDAARRHAALPPAELSAEIRAMAGSRRRAPGISYLEPLLDVLVHGQDIAVPLGRLRPMPTDAAAAVATRVWTMPWPLATTFRARRRLREVSLEATDIEWSVGVGAPVRGPIRALLMLLTGRTAAMNELTGPGLGKVPEIAGHSPRHVEDRPAGRSTGTQDAQ
ncbi:MAG: maleylpyruvate isomerase family mycothiol-dependent enzyme [Solirubrobacteraceae bacterium]